jgi:hypothetical protein
MDDQQGRIQAEWERVDAANQSAATLEHMQVRNAFINNTPGFYTGNDQMMCLTIQMYSIDDWNALFGGRPMQPAMLSYALDCIANNIPLEVSLLLETNVRHRIHEAIFIIHMPNHEQFYDGHMFELEFSEGSHTHQTINRLFDTETRAVVQVMRQYDLLQFLADDYEAADLLERFLDGFNPIQYDAANHELSAHDCAVFFGHDDDEDFGYENDVVVAVVPPPPPPVNDFGAIFQEQLAQIEMEEGENDLFNDPNIIPYWLENNDRINELILLRRERRRVQG